MEDQLTLRPFGEVDLPFLDRLCTDPDAVGPYVWSGFSDPRGRRRRWETDGYLGAESSAVAVVLGAHNVVGIASWEARARGGPHGGCYEIGMALLPEHRAHGVGTAGQRLLVRHLFTHPPAQRLEAQTDAANIAAQTALERAGFRREGLLRRARFRDGAWRDMVVYGILREEAAGPV